MTEYLPAIPMNVSSNSMQSFYEEAFSSISKHHWNPVPFTGEDFCNLLNFIITPLNVDRFELQFISNLISWGQETAVLRKLNKI